MAVDDGALTGQVAIVTGAAGGIGSVVAERLAGDGATVIVADIAAAGAARVAAALRERGLRAEAVAVDVADPASARSMVETTLERHGRIDVLVNNAGLDAPPGLAWEVDEAHWRRVIDTNLSGQWWCTKAALPHMIERQGGRIIFMSSISARVGDPDITVAYNAAKAGLIGLTIGLSVHLERYRIRVNAIAPGFTGTTGTPMTDRQRAEIEAGPFGLMGPGPVADACLYLARPSGDFVTGTVLNVSAGGWRG